MTETELTYMDNLQDEHAHLIQDTEWLILVT